MRYNKHSCNMTWGCSHVAVPSVLSPFKLCLYPPLPSLVLVNVTAFWNMKTNPGNNWQSFSLQQHLAVHCIRTVLYLCVELTDSTGPRLVVAQLSAYLGHNHYTLLTSLCFAFGRWWKFFHISTEYRWEIKVSMFLLRVYVVRYSDPAVLFPKKVKTPLNTCRRCHNHWKEIQYKLKYLKRKVKLLCGLWRFSLAVFALTH